jgi:hypothetical protein
VKLPGEPAPPLRFGAPLATSPVEVRFSWAFHDPASYVLGFSKPSDVLLLQLASSFYFARAPPVGFKVQRATNGVPCRNRFRCSAKVYLERQSPYWKAKTRTHRGRSHCLGDIDSIAIPDLLRKTWPFWSCVNTSLTWIHASMKPGRRAYRQPDRPHPTH